MQVDPNVYALNVMLSLEAGDAFKQANDFEESIIQLESKISKAASNSIQKVSGIVTTALASISQLTTSADELSRVSGEINNSLSAYNALSEDAISDKSDDIIKNKKISEHWNKFKKQYDSIVKAMEKEKANHEDLLQHVEDITKAIKEKNKAHTEENKLVSDEEKILDKLNKSTEGRTKSIQNILEASANVFTSLRRVFSFFAKIDEATEKFVTANYRAYGSQQLLVQSSRELAAATGVAIGAALEVTKALADVATPKDDIAKLNKAIAMGTRVIGLNAAQMANFVKNQRAAGVSTIEQEKTLVLATQAMRKFGLTAQDVNSILSLTGIELLRLKGYFAGSQKELMKFQNGMLVLAGLAKQAGLTTESVAQLQKMMADPEAIMRLSALTGVNIKSQESYM